MILILDDVIGLDHFIYHQIITLPQRQTPPSLQHPTPSNGFFKALSAIRHDNHPTQYCFSYCQDHRGADRLPAMHFLHSSMGRVGHGRRGTGRRLFLRLEN